MKCSTQAALAIGAGYLLGRRRKLRAATVMAVATAVGGTSVGGIALRRGAKLLINSGALDTMPPQVADLVDVVRGDLLDAGKAAATAAVTNRIDSLTDSLHERAERIRNPEEAVAEGADEEKDKDKEPEDNYDPYEDQDEAGEDAEPAKRRIPAQRTPARHRPAASRTRR